jgi:hypothetical protein
MGKLSGKILVGNFNKIEYNIPYKERVTTSDGDGTGVTAFFSRKMGQRCPSPWCGRDTDKRVGEIHTNVLY